MIIIVIIIMITIVIMIVIIEKNCDKINSVVIITTEVIRSVLNSFFFYDEISQVQKSTKRIQRTKKYQKHQKV